MKKIISTEKIPIKLWLSDIEDGALKQAKNLANLPFAVKHIAIMPDSHQGYGMPIGGVMATNGVIIPNAVGVDIGCGMCAVKTSLTAIDRENLKKIMGEIRNQIPVGFSKHKEMQDNDFMPFEEKGLYPENSNLIIYQEYENARKSLGTLGGGNHFIEIQKGDDGHIWIMIHSGSRNLGKQVADYYNKLAVKLNDKWFSEVPKKWELAFLPIDSEEGQAYIREMQYCVDFALANRKLMMDRIIQIFVDEFKIILYDENKFSEMINIAHNYAQMENHFGENIMVHRKGATLAREDTIGIIPGSQGTKSYIVKGKGNPESFNSCSHGAGRKMGRKDAERRLNLEEEIKKLDDQGILHAIRGKGDLDEASGAYKDISVVMENQKDLVDVLVKLQPLAVIKG
jgi:tRNA-splicing ligase RtcB